MRKSSSMLVMIIMGLSMPEAKSMRETVNFDFAWRHVTIGDLPPTPPTPMCSNGTFIPAPGKQCDGLQSDAGAYSAILCENNCCADEGCNVWQFSKESRGGGCWRGQCDSPPNHNTHWNGGIRAHPPSPGPGPPPISSGPLSKKYDDSKWSVVDVPHDFIITGVYNQSTPGSGESYLPRTNAYYRKHFNLPADYKEGTVWINFEGVFHNAKVVLNGQILGSHHCGYTSFSYRLDNVSGVSFGPGKENENVLALFVDGSRGSGWWYEGAGIYRHVQLIATSKVHVETDGVFARPSITGPIASGASPSDGHRAAAQVQVAATVANDDTAAHQLTARYTLVDLASSKVVATASSSAASQPGAPNATAGAVGTVDLNATLKLSTAELWSIPRPYLYTLVTDILSGQDVVDSVNTTVGVRSLDYTADHGLMMNGKHTKVRGFCDHNDFAGVGMAVPDRVKLFRAQTGRSVGGNGRRMSHNPPEPVILDIYDRVGVVVMDENREFGTSDSDVHNMGSMVKRDRNHPSVTIWSFCNEGACGAADGKAFRAVTYQYDGTRPVLGNDVGNKKLNPQMDVQGFSHKGGSTFDNYHKEFPSKPTFASECCSCMTERDDDRDNSGCVASQTNASNGRDYMTGTMVWTLFDYYGESHGWPNVISQYGQFDVAGFPKAAAYWYRTWWMANVPTSSDDRPGLGSTHVAHILESFWDTDARTDQAPSCPSGTFTPRPDSRCNGLEEHSSVKSADECRDACCADSTCNVWQWGVTKGAADSDLTGGCWAGNCDPGSQGRDTEWNGGVRTHPNPNPNQKADVHGYTNAPLADLLVNGVSQGVQGTHELHDSYWQIHLPSPPFNITLVGLDSDNKTVLATHTRLSSGAGSALTLQIDTPSPALGTGSAVFADGQDVALLRATVVDAHGLQVDDSQSNITFEIVSGPGRVIATHNGHQANHQPNHAPYHVAFHGLVRGIVQVTEDSGTARWHRSRLLQIDADGDALTRIVDPADDAPSQDIVVRASAPGLTPATISVPVSSDPAHHVLNVAYSSRGQVLEMK